MNNKVVGYALYACIVVSNRFIGGSFPSGITKGFGIIRFINEKAYKVVCEPYPDCWGCTMLCKEKDLGYRCILSYIFKRGV